MTRSGEAGEIRDERPGEIPLTAGQAQHHRVLRRNPALRMAIWSCYRLPGEVDADRFVDSVRTLVARHAALRLTLVERPGEEPRQVVRQVPEGARLVSRQHVVARSEEQFDRYVRHVVARERRRAWDPAAYPFRFRLFRYDRTVHALAVGLSHLAVDGVGADIVIRDLLRTYADAAAGRAPRGPSRPDFPDSVRDRAPHTARATRREAAPGAAHPDPLTRFVTPPPAPGDASDAGRQCFLSLSGPELAALRRGATRLGCTEFTWLLAAFAATVFRFTRQPGVTISVPVDLRRPTERQVVGMYVLAIPVRVDRPRDPADWPDLPRAVGGALLRAMLVHRHGRAREVDQPTSLSLNYRRMSPLDSRDFHLMGAAAYLPRVNYRSAGVELAASSYPDILDVHAVLDPEVFSTAGVREVSEALERNLTSAPAAWCPPSLRGQRVG